MDRFRRYLDQVGAGPRTVRGYTADVALFAEWFQESRGRKVFFQGNRADGRPRLQVAPHDGQGSEAGED